MKTILITEIIFLFLLFPLGLLSQNKPFIHFTEEDGLVNNSVRCITKDNNGILWIGTQNGLSKYDGHKFLNLRKPDGLPGNWVWAIASDHKKRIYAGCYMDGLAILENDKIIQVLHLKSKKSDTFRRFYYSEKNQILVIGTDLGIYLLKDTTFYQVPIKFERDGKASVMNIAESNGDIYFTLHGGSVGLHKLVINKDFPALSSTQKLDDQQLERFSLTVMNDTIYSNTLRTYFMHSINNSAKNRKFDFKILNYIPWVSCQISNHEILIGGFNSNYLTGGLYTYDSNTGKIDKSIYDIGNVSINEIIRDSADGFAWVCAENGLYALINSPFEMYSLNGVKGFYDVSCYNDIFYILGKEGVYTYDKKRFRLIIPTGKIKSIVCQKFKEHIYDKLKSDYVTITGNKDATFYSLGLKDLDGIYIVTNLGCLRLTDLKTFIPLSVRNFIFDDQGGCYYAHDFARVIYYPSLIFLNPQMPGEEAGGIANVIRIIKAKGIIYFATYFTGLYAIKDGQVYHLNRTNSSMDNNLSDIEVSPSGDVWCTTDDGNLFNVDFDGKLIVKKKLNQENSGIKGTNYTWLKFNNENLFVGTNQGLNIIPIKNLNAENSSSVHFYNQANGYEFTAATSPFTDSQGNVYLHTSEKLIKINNTRLNSQCNEIKFRKIELNNKEIEIESLSGSLPSSTVKISLDFLIFNYPSSRNTKYQYRVNEGNWNDGHNLIFESPKAGSYRIDLQATDLETGQIEHQHIGFTIVLPIWQRWWFILSLTILFISITYLITKLRIKGIRKQQDAKYQLKSQNSELQIRSLQVQMNPHFIFNSLNSIQNFILSHDTRGAIIYLGSLGSIIRMNLENVSKEFIFIEDEIEFLEQYIKIEKMRFKDNLRIELNNSIENHMVLIPPMLIQPIIENAIKHGIRELDSGGRINIDFGVHTGTINITIEDNGVGRGNQPAEIFKKYPSKGLGLIERRLNLLNQKYNSNNFSLTIIDLESGGRPCGTKVEICLGIVKDSKA